MQLCTQAINYFVRKFEEILSVVPIDYHESLSADS